MGTKSSLSTEASSDLTVSKQIATRPEKGGKRTGRVGGGDVCKDWQRRLERAPFFPVGSTPPSGGGPYHYSTNPVHSGAKGPMKKKGEKKTTKIGAEKKTRRKTWRQIDAASQGSNNVFNAPTLGRKKGGKKKLQGER